MAYVVKVRHLLYKKSVFVSMGLKEMVIGRRRKAKTCVYSSEITNRRKQ